MALVADAAGPVLLGLGQQAAGADADHGVVVVVPPRPILKKGPHQLRQRLPVVAPEALHGLVVVVAAPPPDRPGEWWHPSATLGFRV